MAVTPKKAEAQKETTGIVVIDVPHAPIIYFDGAPNFGCNNGIVNITLAAARHMSNADAGVASDIIAVAHLRCNVAAAIGLRQAINDALLLGTPAEGGEN